MKPENFWAKVNKTDDCWLYEGFIDHNGYGCVNINVPGGKATTQKAHRFAYGLLVGPVPRELDLDHKCHVRNCVRPEHLRPVTHKQNLENRAGVASHNKSGHRGVFWEKRRKKWCAVVRHSGKHMHIGYFEDLDEAAEAVKAARLVIFTHNDGDK